MFFYLEIPIRNIKDIRPNFSKNGILIEGSDERYNFTIYCFNKTK